MIKWKPFFDVVKSPCLQHGIETIQKWKRSLAITST